MECSEKLKPLGKRIVKVCTVYPRDIVSISNSRYRLKENPKLMQSFLASASDLNFISREVFSHIFLEVYLEGGYELVNKYIEENFCSSENISELLAAVCLNRLSKIDFGSNSKCIIYNHDWYPFIMEYLHSSNKEKDKKLDYDIDPIVHRLFTEIINPLYGRCDSNKKTIYINDIVEKQNDAIEGVKKACQEIVESCMFQTNQKIDLRDKKLKEMITEKILDPLSNLISKPKDDAKQLIREFIFDSTVIGGVLGLTQGATMDSMGLAAAAGFFSTGLKYIINEKGQKKQLPGKFLLDELRKNRLSYIQYQKILQHISFNQIDILQSY